MKLGLLWVAVAAAGLGCGGAIAKDAQVASAAVVQTATDPDSKRKWDALASDAAGAARDKLLDSDTDARLQSMAHGLGQTMRAEIVRGRDELLDARLHRELTSVRDDVLGPQTRQLVQAVLDDLRSDETGQDLDVFRERLVGAPLRKDLDDLLDDAGPRLSTTLEHAIAPVQRQTDVEAARLERYAVAFAVIVASLIVVVALILRDNRQQAARLEQLERALAARRG